ncbi:hypothetical protein N9J01_00330 [bacterium]|nr:hypothetical protein [bacterium]
MAHFAKLGVNGKVIAVHSLDNSKLLNADSVEDETVGQQELQRIHGWPAAMWIKTSYNTRGGKYYNADGTEASDQSQALRGNYAGIGYSWDEDNAIFWPKQPHASWSKNTTTAAWDAPITYPSVIDDGADPVVWSYMISWNETGYQADNTKGWEATKSNDEAESPTIHDWNGSAWVAR